MYTGYYVDEQMIRLKQEELSREIEHDYLVAQAKQGHRSFHLFHRERKANKLQLSKAENLQAKKLK